MSKLQISVEFHKTLTVLVLVGDFNQYEGEDDIRALARMYNDLIQKAKQRDLILEFHTPRVGTVGINTLTEIYQLVAENEARMIFINFPKSELRYLEITGFLHYVTLLNTRAELDAQNIGA
jgi:hypothetical protein